MIPGFDDSALQNQRPAVAPAIGQPPAGAIAYPGIVKPSSDMQAVRDGRRSTLLGYLVDLTAARSFAAGSALLLPLQGNVFMSDPLFDLAGNAQAGIARVHFQDENFNPVGTYVTVLPSAIYKVPFTQLAVENYAQPGKFLYIIYGVDVDLVPGASQQVQATILNTVTVAGSLGGALPQLAIGGVNALQVTERGFSYGASFAHSTNLGVGGTVALIAPGVNVNGIILWSANLLSAAAGNQICAMLAKASVPGSVTDGDPILATVAIGAANPVLDRLPRPILIPAGKGLYVFSNVAETTAYRGGEYTVL